MLTTICDSLKNWFVKRKIYGQLKIENGTLIVPPDFLQENQYFRIVGSVFNDGVHKYPAERLVDEEFSGEVWAMAVPPTFIALAEKIQAYTESEQAKPSAYTSESFGGYSYSKATDENGAPLSWQKMFAKELNRWRKI